MSDGKRYFWLRLKDDFFDSRRIKKLRKLAGGDTFTIIYLKLQLVAMKHDGVLSCTGLEENVAEELALEINEEPDNVEITLRYLLSCGLAETSDNVNYFFPYAVENVGSEGSSAQRMRDKRSEQRTLCAQRSKMFALSDGEKEIEKEKELEIEKDNKPPKRFTPPTLEEVKAYCTERNNAVDPQHFIDYYTANGWKVGKNAMKDWKAAVRTWESNGYGGKKKKSVCKDYKPVNIGDLEGALKKL